MISALRGSLTESLGTLGRDPSVGDRASASLDRILANDASIDPDLAPALLTVAAANGDAARYDRIEAARAEATSPQTDLRLLHALGSFTESALVARSLAACLTDAVRSQDAPFALLRMLGARDTAGQTWNFIRDHWNAISERLPDVSLPRMLENISVLTSEPAATEVAAFFTTGQGAAFAKDKKAMDQHLERHEVHRRLARRSDELASALNG